jgi:hypothetical protein
MALKAQIEELERSLDDALRQVEGYHLLEDLYALDRAGESNRAEKSTMTEYRNRVLDIHQCSRPEMTAGDARRPLRSGV